ncbi:MAG: MFS transporter [Planctomycetes bacterium]|nr:MFS transporter [Planctomycetota bacterium]
MAVNRAEVVNRNFLALLERWGREHAKPPARRSLDEVAGAGITGRVLVELFESQITCRQLDLVAREMRARDEGYYTIGSSGHEGNAVVGRLVRCTDPAVLHYRSGALMMERYRQKPGGSPIRDTLLSLSAAAEDPISGGRHKVWGSKPLWVPPQTSTIASHLVKAVGMAIAIERMKRLRLPLPVPDDAIVLCSFGDAGANHAVSQTAFNTACWCAYQNIPVPILFVCEDNGLGISVRTPRGWIETNFGERAGLQYFKGDGLDLVDAYGATKAAVDFCRRRRTPTFLHLRMVRLLGHAGSDVETEYHTRAQIEASEALDPLLSAARRLMDEGFQTPTEIRETYERIGREIREEAVRVATRPKLRSAAEVIASLAPYTPSEVNAEAARGADRDRRVAAFGGVNRLPENGEPRHMAVLLNRALHDALVKYPQAIVFGEDVAQKGGVYHVTAGLHKTFGAPRVFNTLLDETAILGLAIGAAQMGLLPIPEIQYLAYYHNAQDQIRGEACSLQFFSNAQFANPMVIRIASMAYQKGFGGHFHNDNSVAALRDVPGLVIALPSRGDDAVKMLRTCLALAKVNGRVVAFLEPIALYMTKDLYEPDDHGWQFDYPPLDETIPIGQGRVYHEDADDLTIITYGNGLYLSLRAARTLAAEHDIHARVVDIRWLAPLNTEFIAAEAMRTGRALIVDECRRSGGMAEPIITALVEEAGPEVAIARVTGEDSYIPLAAAANLMLPSEERIIEVAVRLVQSGATEPRTA